MNTRRHSRCGPRLAFRLAGAICCAGLLAPALLHAQATKKKANPASKVYFADVKGIAEIDTGDTVEDLAPRSVYTAQGTIIETKAPVDPNDTTEYSSTMVYSNGTGAFFDTDTRVEVRRFVQEPFLPNRSDMDVEPSISQTQAFVSRGTVGLCASKLVAGSSMTYNTPHGSVNIRGKRVVIEADPDETRISMLEGDSTVRGGPTDMGGHSLRPGQQAVIRPGRAGEAATVQISTIPPSQLDALEEKTALACAAKKTVYFETRERPNDTIVSATGAIPPPSSDSASDLQTSSSPGGSPPITAFDGDNGAISSGDAAGAGEPTDEIVPIRIVPVNLPTEYTVSPATLVTPSVPNG